jgi:hypothetical protein
MRHWIVVSITFVALIAILAAPTMANEFSSTYLPILQSPPASNTATATPTATHSPTPTSAPSPTATIAPSKVDVRIAPWCSNWDADGNDNHNLNDEYICFQNHDALAANMTGWVAHDAANKRYTFPGFVLSPGAKVRLFTGSGPDGGEALYWGQGNAVWNNDGDTATLLDATGELVDEYTYPAP